MLIPDETLGKRIVRYRKGHKLSQAKLGAIINIDDNYLSSVETGVKVPSILMIARLAVAFGVSIDELLGNE